MPVPPLILFMWGALAMGSATAGRVFWRWWRTRLATTFISSAWSRICC